MYNIKEVSISGVWGRCSWATKLDKDVNIFIGSNGTGKTTFINILIAIIKLDTSKLSELEFCDAKITFANNNSKKTMLVRKDHKFLVYKISREKFVIPIMSKSDASNFSRWTNYSMAKNIEKKVRETISKFINLSNISVHRELHNYEAPANDLFEADENKISNPVDSKLSELIHEISFYLRTKEKDVKNIFDGFQKDMLVSMLYDKSFDSLENIQTDVESIDDFEEQLTNAYSNIQILDDAVKEKILHHVHMIKHAIAVKQSLKPDQMWAADDAFPLPLFARSKYIINKLQEAEKKKEDILLPYHNLERIFYKFTKKILLLNAYSNSLSIHYNECDISPKQLSSGEKQLLILLFETILQEERKSIYITDEPELSLHIEWQEEILLAVKKLNPNAQIIVATHSPAIAGTFPNNVITMQELTNGNA